MSDAAQRVIVIGAGPVGLCLALRLAQQGISVCVVEALGEDNFLEQVPRAGTNHPATLELFDSIGLYDRLAPRGIVAPLVSFNLGVELGQIVVAALVLPVIWKLRTKPAFIHRWVPASSILVALLGGYWFVQRIWF